MHFQASDKNLSHPIIAKKLLHNNELKFNVGTSGSQRRVKIYGTATRNKIEREVRS